LYCVISESIGASCKSYRLIPERQWECDLEHMESLIDDQTKAILINNPSNPCGNVFSEEHLREIVSLAERRRLPIISDEIYGDMVFSSYQFTPIARVSSSIPVIVTGGTAKQFSVPGWRIGWLLVYDQIGALTEYKKGIFNLTQLILGPTSIIQAVIPSLFQHEQELEVYRRQYYSTLEINAMACVERIKGVPGLTLIPPQGTMYLMIQIHIEMFEDIEDDRDFCTKLLEEEFVFVLPGQCFGVPNFFRCVFCAPEEKLIEAFDRIGIFCRSHLKK
jgi:tyrosine aminotransferase